MEVWECPGHGGVGISPTIPNSQAWRFVGGCCSGRAVVGEGQGLVGCGEQGSHCPSDTLNPVFPLRQSWRHGMAAGRCRRKRRGWRAWSWCCLHTPTTRATPLVGRSWPGWRTWPPSQPGDPTGIHQGQGMTCLEGTHLAGSGHSRFVGTLQRDGPQHVTLG